MEPQHYPEMNKSLNVFDLEMGIILDHVISYVYVINLAIISGVLSIFGIVTNAINIMVFLRQNFQETINISLLGLALSDLCSLITLLWVSICHNPLFMYSDTHDILTIELQHFTGSWTHVIFTRVTVFITVFITLERCLCIVFPLKVKNILTPKRVTITIIAIYAITIGTMSKNFFGFSLGWKYIPSRNRSMLGNIINDKLRAIETVSFYMNAFSIFMSFTAMATCTSILIYKLNQRGKWRQSAVGNDQDKKSTIRDRQVVKMVTYLAVIFITSYIPSMMLFIGMTVFPDMNMSLKNQNLFVLSYSISFSCEAINSSVNIFVYYRTSSKYRAIFQSIFCSKWQKASELSTRTSKN